MTVRIRFQNASQPVELGTVVNTYQKGDLFCVKLADGSVYKYPIATIFDIKEN